MSIIYADTETTGLHVWKGDSIFLYCVAIDDGPVELWYKNDETTKRFKTLVEDPNNRVVWQNAVFDLQMLLAEGIKPAQPPHDTMAMAHILHPLWKQINLEVLAKYLLKRGDLDDWKFRVTKWLTSNGFKKGEIWNLPKELLEPYATNDVVAMREIYKILIKELEEKGCTSAYNTECELTPILAEMRVRGVPIDLDYCEKASNEIHTKNTAALIEMFDEAGFVFSPNSNQHMDRIIPKLVEQSSIPSKKTDSGVQCWDKKVLSNIDHPFIKKLLKYRALDKIKGTYYDGIRDVCTDGIAHTSLNHLFTRTGRFSSSEPNLQNIPAPNRWNPEERGFEYDDLMDVKRAFYIRPGFNCWYFDYSQIELRLLAAYSRDRRMIEAYTGGEDLHTMTARAVLNIHGRPLTKAERFIGKQINFAIVYGMGTKALAEMLKVPFGRAQQFLINYHSMYPGVRQLSRVIESQARTKGFFKDLFGRLYRVDSQQIYKSINYLIQGTAAGVMKNCMIKVQEAIKGTGANMLLCVHDDLHVEIPADEREFDTARRIKEAMEDFNQFGLPILVEAKRSTTNWSDSKVFDLTKAA